MSSKATIQALLADAGRSAERREKRAQWARETSAKWREAHRQMDERCSKAVERLSEEEFERLCEAEQAKVDAIMAQLRAVIDKDQWPRELYWGDV
jgi:uncharacterized protein (DUF924 family)